MVPPELFEALAHGVYSDLLRSTQGVDLARATSMEAYEIAKDDAQKISINQSQMEYLK